MKTVFVAVNARYSHSSLAIRYIEKYNIKSTRPTVKDGLDVGNSVDDYIFVNDKIKVNNFKVKQTDASDHYPLILDFELID